MAGAIAAVHHTVQKEYGILLTRNKEQRVTFVTRSVVVAYACVREQTRTPGGSGKRQQQQSQSRSAGERQHAHMSLSLCWVKNRRTAMRAGVRHDGRRRRGSDGDGAAGGSTAGLQQPQDNTEDK